MNNPFAVFKNKNRILDVLERKTNSVLILASADGAEMVAPFSGRLTSVVSSASSVSGAPVVVAGKIAEAFVFYLLERGLEEGYSIAVEAYSKGAVELVDDVKVNAGDVIGMASGKTRVTVIDPVATEIPPAEIDDYVVHGIENKDDVRDSRSKENKPSGMQTAHSSSSSLFPVFGIAGLAAIALGVTR